MESSLQKSDVYYLDFGGLYIYTYEEIDMEM